MRALVKHIEDEFAILLVGTEERTIILPLMYLPRGIKKGQVLKITFTIDHEATPKHSKKILNIDEQRKKRSPNS